MNELTANKGSFSLAPQSLDEALRFADILSKSNLVPKDFTNNPGNILVAIQWGMELGLQPMQAMQNIAVINGRPALWGDAVIGLVKASSVCEYVVEEVNDEMAICKVKRKGEPEQIRTFGRSDAQKAGLLGKQGPWTQYPKRMMQMRARSWALRDVFPDVLRGMPVAEEIMDIEKDVTPAKPATPAAIAEHARIAGNTDDPERLELIAKLEKIASEGTEQDLAKEWQEVLTAAQRKSIGASEWARIKSLLKPVVIEGTVEVANE